VARWDRAGPVWAPCLGGGGRWATEGGDVLAGARRSGAVCGSCPGTDWSGHPRERVHGGCLGADGRGRTRPRGEILRGGAGSRGSGGFRMGQPARRTAGHDGGRPSSRAPGELKHLSTPRSREDSLSSGERRGRSPNPAGGTACRRCPWGVGRVWWRCAAASSPAAAT
jgi:hypothetical protein